MSAPALDDTNTGEIELDPFGFVPGKASAIQGLGGSERFEDPGFAFHTEYVHVAEGPCSFVVRFGGLVAKTGTLQLRVHMWIDGERPQAILGNSSRTQFNRLVQGGGEIGIRFDGFRRVRYALYGSVLGNTDARAETITITLDRPGSADQDEGEVAAELRNSDYGQGKTRALAAMVSIAAPTLAAPVCQAATPKQMREPTFAEWCRQAGRETQRDRGGWITAYILQAFRAYGVMAAGAHGLGFGPGAEEIAAVIRSHDMRAVVAEPAAGPGALPGRLVNNDFLWSVDIAAKDGVNEAFEYIEAYMKCLRPGGLAVHILPFVPSYDQRESGAEVGVFLRADVERLVLQMIARNYEAAQLKIACKDALGVEPEAGPAMAGAFGLIFRKPPIAGA